MPNLRELFTRYKNKRIAIYGLSTETEKAIAELDDFLDIVGLLDGFREEGEIYGKRIISLGHNTIILMKINFPYQIFRN